MFYWIFILMFFMPLPVSAQNVVAPQASVTAQRALIRSITMEGFQLQDKNQFVKLFKPYRNKYLSKIDMDVISQKIQDIYEQQGFGQLVSITYAVNKYRLIFSVSLNE